MYSLYASCKRLPKFKQNVCYLDLRAATNACWKRVGSQKA